MEVEVRGNATDAELAAVLAVLRTRSVAPRVASIARWRTTRIAALPAGPPLR